PLRPTLALSRARPSAAHRRRCLRSPNGASPSVGGSRYRLAPLAVGERGTPEKFLIGAVAVPEHTFCILPLREVPDIGNREKKGQGPVEPDGPGFYVNQRGGVVTSPVACSWEVDAGPPRSELT